ncbi:MAG: hypothetical protein RR334_04025, partial [Clostridia bacterium]
MSEAGVTTEGMTFDLDRNITIQGLYKPCDENSVQFLRYDSTSTDTINKYSDWKKFIAWQEDRNPEYAPNCSDNNCYIDGLPVISSEYLPKGKRIVSWVYTMTKINVTKMITESNKDAELPGNYPIDHTTNFYGRGKIFAYAVYADDSFVINDSNTTATISRDNLTA